MKLMLYTFFILFIGLMFSACQPRGLPVHPSMRKVQKKASFKKQLVKENNSTFEQNQTQDFRVLKLKSKVLAKDDDLFSHIPIINTLNILPDINNIPVLRDIKKLLPKGSKVAKTRVKKKIKYLRTESYSGGTVTDGLDVGMVRLGQSSQYTRLIFDSYTWEGHAVLPSKKANHSGTYIFTHEPAKNRITAIIDGYRGFSALVGDQSELYRGNPTVSTIHLDEYLDDSGFKFVIELKQDVKVYVYELHNPGRIIVDLIPR